MNQPVRKPLMLSLAERVADNSTRLRAMYPQLYWDRDVLVVEQVAQVMRCSLDTVRRIPREELPYSRTGKHNLYFREDVLRYLRSRRVSAAMNVDALLAEIEAASNVTRLPANTPGKGRKKL